MNGSIPPQLQTLFADAQAAFDKLLVPLVAMWTTTDEASGH